MPDQQKARHFHLLTKTPIMPIESSLITPLPEAFELLKKTAQSLTQLSPHSNQTTLVGVPTDELEKLHVVLALSEQKQRNLENDSLEERARIDKQDALARMTRLQVIARQAATGKVDAESVMQVIRAEPDQALAIRNMLHLLRRKHDLSIGDVDVISADPSSSANADFSARKTYVVTMSTNSINTSKHEVSCKLLGGENLEPIFQVSDLDDRLLHFQVTSHQMKIFNWSMLFELEIKAQISINVGLSGKGLTYKCSLVTFLDKEAFQRNVENAVSQQMSRLFA